MPQPTPIAQRMATSRVAAPADLAEHLKEVGANASTQAPFSDGTPNPPQAPPFLQGLPPKGEPYAPQEAVTVELAALIDLHNMGQAFEDAFAKICKEEVPELDRIETLDQFYFYVDALVRWIPEIRVWEQDGLKLHERTPYLRITQFYYFFNQPSLLPLQSPIAPGADRDLTPLSLWLREFAVAWGAFLDTPASAEFLASFKWAPEYGWQDYEKAPEDYTTFNEFFGRTFADIDDLRPVASRDDDRVVVFPAESTFVGQWAISTEAGPPLPAPPSIVVKHIEWPIDELLQDSQHASDFAGGVFCHSFLNTFDYHRQHAPVGGKIIEARFIAAQVYLKVTLDELDPAEREAMDPSIARAVFPHRYLDAADETGYQFVQCRGLFVIESPIGKVAVLPMGMAHVSSVVFCKPQSEGSAPIVLSPEEKRDLSYAEQVEAINRKLEKELVGKEIAKGDMLSLFQFGGSDIVTVFERKANVNVTAQVGVHYPVRSQMAFANINR